MRALKKTIKAIKSRLIPGLLCLLFVIIGTWLTLMLASPLLKTYTLEQISKSTNCRADADSVRFRMNGSVRIKNLILTPDDPQDHQPILTAENVYARFSLPNLLISKTHLKKMVVNDFQLNANQNTADGSWNLSALDLHKDGTKSSGIPFLFLNRGKLIYSQITNGTAEKIASLPLDLAIHPEKDGCSFQLKTDKHTGIEGKWQQGKLNMQGSLCTSQIPQLKHLGSIEDIVCDIEYQQNGHFLFNLSADNLSVNDTQAIAELNTAFPNVYRPLAAIQRFFYRYNAAGTVQVKLFSTGNFNQPSKIQTAGRIRTKGVSIKPIRFPYEITDLSGDIRFDNTGLKFKDLQGRHNHANITINGQIDNPGSNWTGAITFASDNIPLDDDLYDALNPKLRSYWAKFDPVGSAAFELQIIKEFPEIRQQHFMTAKLHDVAATYTAFPYPLKNLTGQLVYTPDSLIASSLQANHNDTTIKIDAKLNFKDAPSKLSIIADNLSVDDTLRTAMPPKLGTVLEKLTFEQPLYLETDIQIPDLKNPNTILYSADIDFIDNTLSMTDPNMTISNLIGKTIMTNSALQFENVTGRLDQSDFSFSGTYQFDPNSPKDSQINVICNADFSDLAKSGPENIQAVIKKYNLSGPFTAQANIRNPQSAQPEFDIKANLLGNTFSSDKIPHEFENLIGNVTVSKNSEKITCQIEGISADIKSDQLPQPSLKLDSAYIVLKQDKIQVADIKGKFKDIILDENFAQIFPESARKLYSRLAPAGRFDLNLNQANYDLTQHPGKFSLEAAIELKDSSFKTKPRLSAVNARIDLNLNHTLDAGIDSALVNINSPSLKLEKKTVTDFTSTVTYCHENKTWQTGDFTAKCHNGSIIGQFSLDQKMSPSVYQLQAVFHDIDLKPFLQDGSNKPAATGGKINGSVTIRSNVTDTENRSGNFKCDITQMRIGQFSPLLRIIMALANPQENAFDRMVMNGWLKGDKLLFDSFKLQGGYLNFAGTGNVNLDTEQIDLVLTAKDSPNNENTSPITLLTNNISAAILRVNVTGPWKSPIVESTTLPVITDTLRLLNPLR